MILTLLAAAPKGPLDTWSPTLLALFALLLPLIALLIILTVWVLVTAATLVLCMATRRVDEEIALDARLRDTVRRDLVA